MSDVKPFPSVILSPLIGPDYRPPFEVVNPSGQASLILVCDHASNAIPLSMNNLGLPPELLSQHIAWDIGAAQVTRRLAERLDAPAVLSGYSRLLIDHNRAPGDPDSIPAISDGMEVPGNCGLSDTEAEWRLETFFWPYHHALTNTLAYQWRHGRAPALVSIHSYTPQLNGGTLRPWHIGILWNRDPRLALRLLEALRADPNLCIGDNEPYSGRELGYTIDTHAGAAGLPHASLEIRQDLLADTGGCDYWAGVIGEAIASVLADPDLHAVVHY